MKCKTFHPIHIRFCGRLLRLVLTGRRQAYATTKKKTNFMAPFYGWGSTASRLEPLQGGSLLFTTKFPEIPNTQKVTLHH